VQLDEEIMARGVISYGLIGGPLNLYGNHRHISGEGLLSKRFLIR
jgi:hypothetical protein